MTATPLKVLVLHGPNLNMTGFREPDVYGKKPLEEIDAEIKSAADGLGIEIRILSPTRRGR